MSACGATGPADRGALRLKTVGSNRSNMLFEEFGTSTVGLEVSQTQRSVIVHDALGFRELCERVMPSDTRFLVLDLDRTVHLRLNLGERLGWELSALQSYGMDALRRMEHKRGRKRLVLEPRHPLSLAHFVVAGLWRWMGPGLHYWLWGKQASEVEWLRQVAVRRHGEAFLQHAQRGTQLTLMRHLADAEPAVLTELAERVWDRFAADQVITREDLQWLRARHPQLEVILTSASPREMVEVAAQRLGVDLAVFSTLERINSGHDKITRLRELRPALFDPSQVSVGISDTQHGEDHCWADYFTVVVDINSEWPFPNHLRQGSPTRAIHSARVLTRHELARRAAGDAHYLDPRRTTTHATSTRHAAESSGWPSPPQQG